MLQNPRLGAPAFEFLHYSLRYEWPTGWHLTVSGRRDGSSDYEFEYYDNLDTPEAADLLALLVDRQLGL